MALQQKVDHSTAQHSTAQHSTAQHSTAQHNTTQHNTTQHNTPTSGKPQRFAHLSPAPRSTSIAQLNQLSTYTSASWAASPRASRTDKIGANSSFGVDSSSSRVVHTYWTAFALRLTKLRGTACKQAATARKTTCRGSAPAGVGAGSHVGAREPRARGKGPMCTEGVKCE